MSAGLDKLFGVHAHALQLHARRAELLAANIANADTPHYKAKDIDFKAVLRETQNSENIIVQKTNRQHLGPDAGGLAGRTQYRVPQQPALDGNTVDTQIEKSLFTENAVRYQISLQLLGNKIKGVINALRVDA